MPVETFECAATDASTLEGALGMAACARAGADRTLDVGTHDPADLQVRLPLLFDHILGEVVHERRPAGCWTVASSLEFEVGESRASSMQQLLATPVALSSDGGIVQGRGVDTDGRGVAGAMLRLLYVADGRSEKVDDEPWPEVNPGATIAELVSPTFGRSGTAATLKVGRPRQWANGMGVMHGGIVGASAVLCAAAAVDTDLAREPLRSFRADYLRPVAVDRGVEFQSQVVRRGRRLTHVQVIVGPADSPDARLHLVFATTQRAIP